MKQLTEKASTDRYEKHYELVGLLENDKLLGEGQTYPLVMIHEKLVKSNQGNKY